MKRFVAIFLFIFSITALVAVPVSFTFDLRSADSFFLKGVRIDSELSFDIKNIRLTFPFRYGKSKDYNLNALESGILVGVWPIEDMGLFAEVSLIKIGCMWGLYAPKEGFFFSSEASVGWEFRFNHFVLRPKYTLRSTFSSEDTKEEKLKTIPQFSSSRISLHIGVCIGGKNE